MSKKKNVGKKRSRKKRAQQRQARDSKKSILPTLTPQKRSLHNLFSSAFEKFVVLVTLFSAIYIFYPRVSILTNDSFSQHNPFENPFYIYNSGNIPITNFEFFLEIPYLEDIRNNKLYNVSLEWNSKNIPYLGIEKKSFISLKKTIKISASELKKANIEIHYSFKLPFVPYKFQNKASFQAEKIDSGKIVWLDNN